MRLKTLATHPVWREPRTVFGVWMLTGVIFAIVKLLIGKYNNYKIFEGVYWHAIEDHQKAKSVCMDTYHLDMLPAPLFYMLFLYVFPICIHSLFRQMHESYNIAATRRRIIYPAVPTAILTNVLCFHL